MIFPIYQNPIHLSQLYWRQHVKKGDTVLDIGANDGTLLNFFKKDNFVTIGCEPAKNLTTTLKKNCKYTLTNFWNSKDLNKILIANKVNKPKLITAIGMFYDLDDPSKFISVRIDTDLARCSRLCPPCTMPKRA